MQDRVYNIRISPENIINKIFPVTFVDGEYVVPVPQDPCCEIVPEPITGTTSATTFIYSSMTQILSGGTNGNSLLNITIPVFLSENTVDIGYYNVFDGFVVQQETMLNFLFTQELITPFQVSFYNTSDKEFKKYLNFSDYKIDWGDNSATETVNSVSPTPYTHTYSSSGKFTITMSGLSPWGYNVIKKDVYLPFTDITIDNPNGEAFFIPAGGNWSATPISYDYIYHYDETPCEENQPCCEFTSIPFIVSGYTVSSLNDTQQYGKTKFVIDKEVKGSSGDVSVFKGVSSDSSYTAYTINDIEYRDYPNGTTIFVAYSSGCSINNSCSAITKNEALMNVISEASVQSSVFVERGKNTAIQEIQRLGEITSFGNLEEYGYKYFTIKNT